MYRILSHIHYNFTNDRFIDGNHLYSLNIWQKYQARHFLDIRYIYLMNDPSNTTVMSGNVCTNYSACWEMKASQKV